MKKSLLVLFVLLGSLDISLAQQSQNSFQGINPGKYLGPNFNPYAGVDKSLWAQSDLRALPTVGFDGHGYYPFCADVVRVYEKYHGQLDWNAISKHQKEQQTKNPELVETEVLDFYSGKRAQAHMHVCFGGKTEVTVLMKNKAVGLSDLENATKANATVFAGVFSKPTIYKSNENEMPFVFLEVPMEQLDKYNMDDFDPYVLSSTVELIPESAFQVDCWSKIHELHVGRVDEEHFLNHIEVVYDAAASKAYVLHATPDHRFYVCSDQGACSWQRASNLKKGMNYYGNHGQRYAYTSSTYLPVEGNEGFGVDRYGRVFNLSTETYTYYVGPNNGRVLVHNIR